MNIAIIVAAGISQRFGGDIPKQFLEVFGKPLLIHTLEKFQTCESIDEIILVLAEDEISRFKDQNTKYKISKLKKIVSGGKTRAESVFNGLREVDSENVEIVAVHDGARPLVTCEEISNTIDKARETGAACLVAKVTDTIKEVSVGKITNTIDRTKLRRALTPQCFRYEILKKAFEKNEIGEDTTDECYLVEKMGFDVSIVEGSGKNIKITTPEDFIFIANFLE